MMKRNYFNPDGLVEVTPANVDLPLSQRFRLRDFLTHDQDAVWPKYVIVEERLIDKLELVAQELESVGIRADHARILSGFRAPYYNARWVAEGAARASRHQYGDAADLIVDNDGDGLTPVKYSQFLTQKLPGSRMELIDGAAHLVMLENPQALSRAILSFLAGL